MSNEIAPASREDVERLKKLAYEAKALKGSAQDRLEAFARLHAALIHIGGHTADHVLSIMAWGEAAERRADETLENWRLAFSVALEKVVDNWEHDVSPKVAGGRLDKVLAQLVADREAAESRAAQAEAAAIHNRNTRPSITFVLGVIALLIALWGKWPGAAFIAGGCAMIALAIYFRQRHHPSAVE